MPTWLIYMREAGPFQKYDQVYVCGFLPPPPNISSLKSYSFRWNTRKRCLVDLLVSSHKTLFNFWSFGFEYDWLRDTVILIRVIKSREIRIWELCHVTIALQSICDTMVHTLHASRLNEVCSSKDDGPQPWLPVRITNTGNKCGDIADPFSKTNGMRKTHTVTLWLTWNHTLHSIHMPRPAYRLCYFWRGRLTLPKINFLLSGMVTQNSISGKSPTLSYIYCNNLQLLLIWDMK